MENNSYKYFVEDSLEHLINRSIEAREKSDLKQEPFEQGYSFAYYEILNFLIHQAEIFEIKEDLKDKIKNFSPSM